MPHSYNISHDFHKLRHAKVSCDGGSSECWTRTHPIATLCRLSLITINSVMASCSRVPKTLGPLRWRHRLNKCKSKNGYSMSFCWYALPKYVTYASTSPYGLACTEKPPEHWCQCHQWYTSGRSLLQLHCCWNVSGWPQRPYGKRFRRSIEWTPRRAHPTPRTQSHGNHEFSPKWEPCSKYAGTCHLEWLTKRKTPMNKPEHLRPQCNK